MNRSLPGSSVHGILQVRILAWVAMLFSRGSSWLRDWTQVTCIVCRSLGWTVSPKKICRRSAKWILGSITTDKASGSDRIPAGLFQILKDNAVKLLHSICQQIWKTHQWPQDWKRSVSIPIPKKGNAKEYSNYRTVALFSHVCKVMLKILQTRLQNCMNWELPDVQAGFRKGKRTRDQIANICWIIENSRKTSTSASLTLLKPLTVWNTINSGKFLKSWEYQTTLPASWETYMQVKKQQLELLMEQWTGSILGKEYINAVYCHLAYLTYMQSTSCKKPDWMSTSWNQDCRDKYQ